MRIRVVTAAAVAVLIAAISMISPPTALTAGPRAADQVRASPAPVTYFIADGTGRAGYRAGDRELAVWAIQAWQRLAEGGLRFESAPETTALVRLYWAGPADGQYGEMRPLVVGGRPGAAVYIRPDTASLGPEIARQTRDDDLLRDTIVYLTCVHELGHAIGLPHTSDFRDIMYFFGFGGDIGEYFGRYRRQLTSRADIANVSGLSAGDIGRLRSLHAAR